MTHTLVAIAVLCVGVTSALVPSYLYPLEQKNLEEKFPSIEELPSNGVYEYHIVPRDQYEIVEQAPQSSIPDLSSPLSAISFLGSTALSAVYWTASKLSYIILGAALFIGFCTFTPYCTLTLNKSLIGSYSRSSMIHVPHLEEIENVFKEAYKKYREIQS